MDPLVVIINELELLRSNVDQSEDELKDMEMNDRTNEPRYARLSKEREMLLNSLCSIRHDLCSKAVSMEGNAIYAKSSPDGQVSYYVDTAPPPQNAKRTAQRPSDAYTYQPEETLSLRPQQQQAVQAYAQPQYAQSQAEYAQSQHTAMLEMGNSVDMGIGMGMGMGGTGAGGMSVGGGIGGGIGGGRGGSMGGSIGGGIGRAIGGVMGYGDARRALKPTVAIPETELDEYLLEKARLSNVMREFTNNVVHFFAPDSTVVAMAGYQDISKHTKRGEDPARFLKGNSRKFRTGFNKKTDSYTYTTIFFPRYKAYAGLEEEPVPRVGVPMVQELALTLS